MDVLAIPGITDGPDNDYEGQMRAALEALADHDVVFVHVESPDEAGHAGDVMGKLEAIQQVDKLMVPLVLAAALSTAAPAAADGAGATPSAGTGGAEAIERAPTGLRVLVLPDHPTPLEIRTHVAEPVRFVMWGPGFAPNGAATYQEDEARATGLAVAPGHLLMSMFLG
jgi:2,3-bisphosphoglycerate-independent phosphoglycerate mutase